MQNDSRKSPEKQILVIDDDFDTALVVKLMLQSCGYEVDMFIDARVALSNFQPQRYSLAIIDFRMGGIDGFELYERFSEMDNKMKVCFMSGYDNSEALARFQSKHHGFSSDCFLRKPLDIDGFIDRVNKMTANSNPIETETDVMKEV